MVIRCHREKPCQSCWQKKKEKRNALTSLPSSRQQRHLKKGFHSKMLWMNLDREKVAEIHQSIANILICLSQISTCKISVLFYFPYLFQTSLCPHIYQTTLTIKVSLSFALKLSLCTHPLGLFHLNMKPFRFSVCTSDVTTTTGYPILFIIII